MRFLRWICWSFAAVCTAAMLSPVAAAQVATQSAEAIPTESSASIAVDAARPLDLESRQIRARSGNGAALPVLGGQGRASSTASLWLQTAVVLGIVLTGMWLVLKWLRKAGLGGAFGGSGSAVQVLNRGYLSSKHQIVLVRFGGRLLLVGVGPQNVNVLSEIADPAEAAQVLGKLQGARPGSASRDFQEAIAQAAEEYVEQPAGLEPAVQAPTREQIGAIRGEIRSLLAKMQSIAKKPETE